MANNTISFQIRQIDCNIWYDLTNDIDRRLFDEIKKSWESRSIEDYFKALILKISKLSKDEKNKIVRPEIKIKLEGR